MTVLRPTDPDSDHKMPKPTLAFITTLYGGDDLDYFDAGLKSLLNQSYGSDHLHLYLYVDGPIPDGHERYLDEHGHHFHRIIHGEVNRGLPHGLNVLIDALEDEPYVLRMDMDDLCHPRRAERQIAFLESRPDIDMVGCCTYEIDEQGTVVFERDYLETPEAIREGIARGNAMLHPTYCMRREVLSQHGMRYRPVHLNEDLQFLFDMLAKDLRLYNLQERLFYWRLTRKFFTRRSVRRCFIEYRVYMRGIYRLFGLSPKLIYPNIRLVFRLLPGNFARTIYKSPLRNAFLKG